MKKFNIILIGLFLVFAVGTSAQATLYTFEGFSGLEDDNGNFIGPLGVGSATMEILIDEDTNTLTAIVNNTSPTDLIDGNSGGNSPGISGFGFDLNPDDLNLLSWEMTATTNLDPVTYAVIGSSENSNLDWQMNGNFINDNKIDLDYLPNNEGDADGMLFNPDAYYDTNNTLPGGQNDVYFTTATLTMTFDKTPTLNYVPEEFSPFVRMQNVGGDGEGSLKLAGTPTNNPVPEPATMLLLGSGLLGIGYTRRKKKNS